MPLDPPAIEITYLGSATAQIEIAGLRFITDPAFDAAGTQYKSGPIILKKLSAPALARRSLGKIDVALVSHDQHADNLDDSGRELLADIPLVLTTPDSARRLGHHAVAMEPWQVRTIESPEGVKLQITATPARHGPPGIQSITGEVTGFVISLAETGEDLVYVTGDTVWYEGVAQVAQRFEPRVVLLFAGAAQTARGPFDLTMDTNDALEAANAFRSATFVPVHHEGWAHFTEDGNDYLDAFRAMKQEHRIRVLAVGEKRTF